MSNQNRLSKLEVTIGHAAASGDPEEYCLLCLGPGGYRRLVICPRGVRDGLLFQDAAKRRR